MSAPWQLYVFCAVYLIESLVNFTFLPGIDPCQRNYGHACNSGERVLQNYWAMAELYMAVFFLVLTLRNKDDAPKLKRLAFVAIYCVVAGIAMFIMMGSDHLGGIIPKRNHITGLVLGFVLLMIMASAVNTDSPLPGRNPIKENLGLNMKGFLALYALLLVVWIFLGSDVQQVGDVLAKPEKYTDLAKMLWFAWSVQVLLIFLPVMFVLAYGDDGDDEAICISIILLNVLQVLLAQALKAHETVDTVKLVTIHNSVISGVALLAVLRYRIQKRRGEYQAVPESAVV